VIIYGHQRLSAPVLTSSIPMLITSISTTAAGAGVPTSRTAATSGLCRCAVANEYLIIWGYRGLAPVRDFFPKRQ
ncbi:MAG: hypothetical protein J7K30_05855, partial [Deltaproteobacteria bacterium]|nr:hypothetical protein [Deltaproteobacteria bacterium]